MPRSPLFGVVALALCIAAAAAIAWTSGTSPCDDAWIYLRYTRNLLEGHGWVYNIGDSVNATTGPLNTIVLALFGISLGDDLNTAQLLAFTLGYGSAALCVLHVLAPRAGRFGAVFAASALLLAPMTTSTFGMETPLLIGSVCAGWLAWTRGRYRSCALLIGLAALARPEGGLFAVALLLDRLARRERISTLPLLGMLTTGIATVLPWAVYSLVTFGSLTPNTLSAKQAQHGWWRSFWSGAKRSLESSFDTHGIGIDYHVFVAILIAGSAWIAWRRLPALPVLIWTGLQVVGYETIDAPFYHWYAAPLHLSHVLVIATAVGELLRHRSRFLRSTGVVLGVAHLALSLPDLQRQISYPRYHAAAAWIAGNTPEDVSVGCVEIGVIGHGVWPRNIVDPCGLVTPNAVAAVARRDFGWWFEQHRPNVLVVHDPPRNRMEDLARRSAEQRGDYREADGWKHPEVEIWVRR